MKLDANLSAVITGGASGLGAASARLLASHGVKVALFDLNEELGEALAKQLQEALESQIKDYNELEERCVKLEKEANENVDSYRRCITVISYLETKLGLNSV